MGAAGTDFYASPFGIAYSAYMERPSLSRLISRAVFGGDTKRYYESMGAVAGVADGGTIIDCPCGAGPAFRALSADAALRYLAVDLSPSMIARARKRARRRGLGSVELVEADATEIPVVDDSADLFLSLWGLHCFDDPAAALAETARVLKPRGRLVGSCFVRGHDSFRQRRLIRPGSGDLGRVGTQAEVEAWLAGAGFAVSSTERSGPFLFFDASKNGLMGAVGFEPTTSRV
jgi:SAM-dependent methyltransferase